MGIPPKKYADVNKDEASLLAVMEVRERVKSSPSREESEEESDSEDSFVNISSPLTENEETAPTDSLKLPIHILDHRIRIFTQTTVPHDLRRLRTHRENIAQLHKDGNWTKLNSEQINANRTVQQLKMHLHALDDLRHQVEPGDVEKFDQRTTNIRQQILSAIKDYGMVTASLKIARKSRLPVGVGEPLTLDDDTDSQPFDELLTISDKSAMIPQEEPASQSWEELRTELMELNELVKVLQSEIKGHGETIAQMERNVDQAALHIDNANLNVQTATRLKVYALPVGGAILGGVVGGAVGGPIGAIAGLKVGAITAAAGGAAGAIGGALVGLKAKTLQRWSSNKKDN